MNRARFEFNENFLGNTEAAFEDGSQPVRWPLGEFEGRYSLSTALEIGALAAIKEGAAAAEPALPKFKILTGSVNR